MTMNRVLYHAFYILLTPLLFGCSSSDQVGNTADQPFRSGTFVIHQGTQQNGTAAINFIDRYTNVVYESIYQNQNNEGIGSSLHSMAIAGDRTYLVVSQSDKVEIVHADDFHHISTIVGLETPKYIVIKDDKAYVSEWGSDATSGSIAVVDLATNDIVKRIQVGSGPEQMFLEGNKLYVPNGGGMGKDSSITIINTTNDEVSGAIRVTDNPKSMIRDINGDLWVLSTGYFDGNQPDRSTHGSLIRLKNDKIVQQLDLPTGIRHLSINASRELLYFSLGPQIYIQPITDPMVNGPIPQGPQTTISGMKVDPNTNLIYVADAVDFSSRGVLHIIDGAGTSIATYDAGIIPRDFYFRN